MLQDARIGPPAPSSSGSTPAADHAQSSRRIFVGPMPHNLRVAEHEEDEAAEFVSQHGLRIFLQQGGHIEEWTEAKAKEYKERLTNRILESAAWYAVSGSKKNKRRKSLRQLVEWKGDTFEIGKVIGLSVNMLAAHEESLYSAQDVRQSSEQSISKGKSAMTVHWNGSPRPSLGTARSTQSSFGFTSTLDSPAFTRIQTHQSAPVGPLLSASSEETHGEGSEAIESTSSRTPLFSEETPGSPEHPSTRHTSMFRGAQSDGDLPKKSRAGLKSILTGPGKDKGKGKAVRYADTPTKGTASGIQSPAPPEDVLSRSPIDVEDSSASAAAEMAVEIRSESEANNGPVSTFRDRMLVRVFRCDHESLGTPFVEQDCRITRGLDSKEWDEFLVIWRNHRLELYEDYGTPCKEHFLGHKHLAFVIPLSNRTKLSLFSSVDFSFCLICPPTPTRSKQSKSHRSIFHRSPRGLNVFILKPKSRSRSVDWMWRLWRELGGMLPDTIEVSCPLVHSRVSMPIPETGEDWKGLTRDFIIDQCTHAMESSFAWQTVVQMPILSGRRLELCWRSDTKLDWVWLKDDVEGERRDWEVLFGMALNYLGNPAQLELHLSSHYPARVQMADGKHMEEPPSIEGFVHMNKRKTQVRVQYYLSTHDGYLCAVQVDKVATPPTPTDLKSFSKNEEEFREDEDFRLRTQLLNTRGFWDLRNILLVRRASHVTAQTRDESVRQSQAATPTAPSSSPGPNSIGTQAEEPEMHRTESDIGDEGGDDGLATAADKGRVKMHRSFELVLKNGRIIRFETHSSKVAVEWVTHLRALVEYWTKRYQEDTVTEMNIIKGSLGGDRITVSRRYCKNGHRLAPPAPDSENASLYMDEYWNWCVLDGCRQIVKSGRIFMKSKLRGQYKHVHLILIKGCLVQFRVSGKAIMHHHQMGRINLIDSYVCSGYYAALALPQDEYDPNAPAVAKLYPDGLETKDLAEDTLFTLWFHPHVTYAKGDFNKVPIPPMSAKHKVVIFRARSKLERDAWCWALNCEIERLVRRTQDRERMAREQGSPV